MKTQANHRLYTRAKVLHNVEEEKKRKPLFSPPLTTARI